MQAKRGIYLQPVRSAVVAVVQTKTAMAAVAVLMNVGQRMAGVGLEAACACTQAAFVEAGCAGTQAAAFVKAACARSQAAAFVEAATREAAARETAGRETAASVEAATREAAA
jgi:hypothetical protein